MCFYESGGIGRAIATEVPTAQALPALDTPQRVLIEALLLRPPLVRIEDEKFMLVGIVLGSDPDLCRSRGVNQAFARRPIKHRAVVKLSAILIGIGMRIKVYNAHRTIFLNNGI